MPGGNNTGGGPAPPGLSSASGGTDQPTDHEQKQECKTSTAAALLWCFDDYVLLRFGLPSKDGFPAGNVEAATTAILKLCKEFWKEFSVNCGMKNVETHVPSMAWLHARYTEQTDIEAKEKQARKEKQANRNTEGAGEAVIGGDAAGSGPVGEAAAQPQEGAEDGSACGEAVPQGDASGDNPPAPDADSDGFKPDDIVIMVVNKQKEVYNQKKAKILHRVPGKLHIYKVVVLEGEKTGQTRQMNFQSLRRSVTVTSPPAVPAEVSTPPGSHTGQESSTTVHEGKRSSAAIDGTENPTAEKKQKNAPQQQLQNLFGQLALADIR